MLGFSASRHPTPPARPDDAATNPDATTWRRHLARSLIVYAISRLCVLAGAGIVAAEQVVEANEARVSRPRNAVSLVADVLTSWDGRWYFEIVRHGYPADIPADVTFHMTAARAAFFPVYPLAVRALDALLPGGDVTAGLALNLALGMLVVFLVGALARELFDDRVAGRAMTLTALFPGSFVLTFAYAEATLLVLAAACLLCLRRDRWAVAGLLAALAGATRPNGIALAAACGVASIAAIRSRRAWRSLVAPLLAPIGFIAFQLILDRHAGQRGAWFRVQREAWGEGWSFGRSALDGTIDAIARPLASPTDFLTAATVVATLGLCVAAWKRRLPGPEVAYSAAVVLLMIMPSTVTARPRFLFTAFPLLISAAAWIGDDDSDAWTALCALSAAGLVTATALYGVYGAIP